MKNKIINGNFDIWQRGTSFVDPNAVYGPDRWGQWGGAGNTITYSRQAFALGQTDVPGEPEFYININKTAGAGAGPEVRQFIESVRTFSGETVTLSFYAKADAARNMAASITQNFGTGGSPSGGVGLSAGTHNLTTSWQKFTKTVTLGSISGKTLGTNGDDNLQLLLGWSTNANGQIDIAQVQLESGSTATDFEDRPIGQELMLAQRYFCKSYDLEEAPGASITKGQLRFGTSGHVSFGDPPVFNSHTTLVTWSYPVSMRKEPSISLYDTAGTLGQWSTGDKGDVTAYAITPSKESVRVQATVPADDNSDIFGHIVADAEF